MPINMCFRSETGFFFFKLVAHLTFWRMVHKMVQHIKQAVGGKLEL